MPQATINQQHLHEEGFTPGPWMVATSCSYRRIIRECGKPVIVPLPKPKGPYAYLSVTEKDLDLALATPGLIASTVNLVGILGLSLGDHSDAEGEAYRMGREALAAAVNDATAYSMIRKNEQLAPLTQSDLHEFGIAPGPWREDSISGDKVIVNEQGTVVVRPDTHWADNHPDLAAEMANLEAIAAAPWLMVALVNMLGAVYPSVADFNEAQHQVFEDAVGLIQDVLDVDRADKLLSIVLFDD